MKKKILIIEDNRDILDNTVELMELEGYEVLFAHNGHEGIDLAIEHCPDLILCDIWMPEIDGYEVFNRLSKNQATSSIPFVVFSASVERSDVEKALKMGATDYVKKPYVTDHLLETVEKVLERNA